MGNVNDNDALIEQKPKETQLLYAAETGKLDLLQRLVHNEAFGRKYVVDVDVANSSALTSLFLAAKEGYTECVKTLLEAGAKVDGVGQENTALTPIWVATYGGHVECVKLLLQSGANLKAKHPETPLYIAAREGRSECLKLLIAAGSDLEVKNSQNQTPLSVACREIHLDCVQLLLLAGSNVNTADRSGHTPLFFACVYAPDGHPIVEVLLIAGANVNQTCKTHNSLVPLHICANRGKVRNCQLLLLFGAKLDKESLSGQRPREMAEAFPLCQGFLKSYEGYVPPLKQICCWRIRKSFGAKRLNRIPDLPIPKVLHRYLNFISDSSDIPFFSQ